MRKGTCLLLILITAMIFTCQPALAQPGGRLVLLPLDLSAFPKVNFMMEAYTPGGQFMADLSERDLLLIEDGAARPVEHFTRVQSGLHLVAAFNTTPGLGNASGGLTPLEQVRKGLLDWSVRQGGAAQDEFSIVGNSGGQFTKLSDPARWSAALRDFAPDLLRGQPSLTSLTQAFDLVTDAGRRTTSKRAILWITPPLAESNLPALPNLAERASQLGARIFVWLLVPPGSVESKSHAALADLAQRTGGQFAAFSTAQPVPDLEAWLQPLRYIYKVDYTSAARASATHRLQVILQRDEDFPINAEQRFTLNFQLPNPVFLSPPARIQRNWVQGAVKNEFSLKPEQVELAVIVEFPDAQPRALASTRLYIDNQLVDESSAPTVAAMTLPLTNFESSQQHTIRVEVEDILGFKRSSIEIPVEIVVDPSPLQSGLDTALFSSSALSLPLAGGALMLVLGGIVATALIMRRKAPNTAVKAKLAWERPHLSAPQANLRRMSLSQDAPARLVRLTEDGQTLPANSIPLAQAELTLGSDPKKVVVVVESTSMDGMHARIRLDNRGDYSIFDAGSVAGTWVNYEPVSADGATLAHGDVVHLGREAYRFEQKIPRQVMLLQVRRLKREEL